MTKKDFEAIARAIYGGRCTADSVGQLSMADYIARSVADVCAESNEQFDRDRFLRACGLVV